MNRWNIPDVLEQEIIQRDRSCVYCGVAFGAPDSRVGDRPSWEHIVNDARISTGGSREFFTRPYSSSASQSSNVLRPWEPI